MYVMLVTMPWAALDTPPLALGILQELARTRDTVVETRCANIDFYDWATDALALTVDEYDFFAIQAYFEGYGDWVFSSALYDDPEWRLREFTDEMAGGLGERQRELCIQLHRLAPRFIDELAARIVEAGPEVVGFTTTFQQNTASLAMARKIKMLAPAIRTVFGGANCDGVQGEALHRNFPFVDYVVRGEGERAFPELLDVLAGRGEPASVPGLCWRTEDRAQRVNVMSPTPLPAGQLSEPDFDAYFTRIDQSPARSYLEPKLVLEGSRGCWWGEKHHCTFCGLNGSSMRFRSKDPEEFLQEIVSQTRRHRLLDIIVVDNILDMGYLQNLLPQLVELGHDYRFHYEIKSNLHYHQLRILADAGLVQVQSGIESLSTPVLRLMRKGVTGCQNVRHLRDAQSAGVWVVWNYLYGFPGETADDYDSVIRQVPALHHLTPPDAVTRIAVERFSPYFDQPELGFTGLRPAAHYARTYDLPERELSDLAYLFEAPPAGIDATRARRLADTVERWRDAHESSRLTHCDLGHKIVLVSRRPEFDWTTYAIHDPVEVATFRLLADPRSVPSLARRLTAKLGVPVSEVRIGRLLESWREAGILYEDADRFVHVAPRATNAELTRIGTDASGILRRSPAGSCSDGRERAMGERSLRLSLWRDYHDRALRLPGMHLGTTGVTEGVVAAVGEYYRSGARRAELIGVVDLTDEAEPESAVAALDLIRELTAWGIVVDWRARLTDATRSWVLFSHLYPPWEIDGPAGAEDARRDWARGFFLGKCHYRTGPGFLEVRDHRSGVLNRIVIDDPVYLDTVDMLRDGAPIGSASARVLRDLRAESLILSFGGRHWWAAYRPYRWAHPPFHV